MYKKTIYVLLVAFLITNVAEGKKLKRSRRPKNEEDTTPQPSVVSYSTFGFNDVGSYDGFVPTSPDYANYLTNVNQESTTRLYAPAFPTALDPTGLNSNYPLSSLDGFGNNDDGGPQSSMVQYPQSSMNFFITPTFDGGDIQNKNVASNEGIGQNTEEGNGPVYGTKINLNSKRVRSNFNNSEYNMYNSGQSYNSHEIAPRFTLQGNHAQTPQDSKITYGESISSIQSMPSYVQNYPPSELEDFVKPDSSNILKFPRVVDFTKPKQYYPTELDNKYQVSTYSSLINNKHNENPFINNNDDNDKENRKPVTYSNKDYSPNYLSSLATKPTTKSVNYNSDFKDNYKNKWATSNHSNDSKNWRSPFKGFEYSSDHSNTSVKFDYSSDKSPFHSNVDELVPAGTNIVESSNFNFPETDFTNFKKIPEIKFPDDDDDDDFEPNSNGDNFKSEEFLHHFKNLYTTTPVTTTQWGNVIKSSDYSIKHRLKRPQYEESYPNDVVHIPRRPYSNLKHSFGQQVDNTHNDYSKNRPHKTNKPSDWTRDAYKTRFKSEEDLLDLRNHDTSHPSYLPSNRPNNNDLVDDSDYKKLVEKWRQSYLKSKYRDAHRDYESYASEQKPLHVPIPKPYPIEVPHPVIVPVPQPYPVRVPVPKPVAVPVIKELTVPIEKPVPYPVVKKVPYPVEKPVPVPVEKEVQVPVIKPYPVHIPHVRPVFHHSRPPRDEFESEVDADEDDYHPRLESSKKILPYRKKPRSTRNRSRRPTRMTYLNRNTSRRRWPNGYRSSETTRDTRSRRPTAERHSSPYRHHDLDADREYDNDQGDYYYCKRTGRC